MSFVTVGVMAGGAALGAGGSMIAKNSSPGYQKVTYKQTPEQRVAQSMIVPSYLQTLKSGSMPSHMQHQFNTQDIGQARQALNQNRQVLSRSSSAAPGQISAAGTAINAARINSLANSFINAGTANLTSTMAKLVQHNSNAMKQQDQKIKGPDPGKAALANFAGSTVSGFASGALSKWANTVPSNEPDQTTQSQVSTLQFTPQYTSLPGHPNWGAPTTPSITGTKR